VKVEAKRNMKGKREMDEKQPVTEPPITNKPKCQRRYSPSAKVSKSKEPTKATGRMQEKIETPTPPCTRSLSSVHISCYRPHVLPPFFSSSTRSEVSTEM